VIDPERPMTLTPETVMSKSRNSPFMGQKLAGRAVLTIFEGRVVHDLDSRLR
jgi:dihydroorotase